MAAVGKLKHTIGGCILPGLGGDDADVDAADVDAAAADGGGVADVVAADAAVAGVDAADDGEVAAVPFPGVFLFLSSEVLVVGLT